MLFLVASIHYYSTETDITVWIIFHYSRQYFEKVVRWGSGSFEFYSLICVILPECHSGRGHSRDVTQQHPLKGASRFAKRLDRGETLKHYFQTDAVSSSWLNQSRDDRKSKTRPRNKPSDHQTNQSGRSRQNESRVNIYHEASVTSYVYEIRPKIRGPFDGC